MKCPGLLYYPKCRTCHRKWVKHGKPTTNHPFLMVYTTHRNGDCGGIWNHQGISLEMEVSQNRGTPFIIHLNGIFQSKSWLVVGPPLWKIWKSVGMIIPNIWKNKKWQPNHQPVIHLNGIFQYINHPFWVALRKAPRCPPRMPRQGTRDRVQPHECEALLSKEKWPFWDTTWPYIYNNNIIDYLSIYRQKILYKGWHIAWGCVSHHLKKMKQVGCDQVGHWKKKLYNQQYHMFCVQGI